MLEAVEFEALGQPQKLRLSMQAGAKLEAALGQSINEILGDGASRLGFQMVIAFFVASLEDGKGVIEKRAMAIMEDIGGLKPSVELMNRAVEKAFPDSDGEGEPDGSPSEKSGGNAKRAG